MRYDYANLCLVHVDNIFISLYLEQIRKSLDPRERLKNGCNI